MALDLPRLLSGALVVGLAAASSGAPVHRISPVAQRSETPSWVDSAGHPNRDVGAALALLNQAAAEGLDPLDYAGAALERRAAALRVARDATARDVAAFEAGMTASTLRYFRDLHIGRVDPRAIGFNLDAPAHEHDFGALLRSALATHRIAETAAALVPPLPAYQDLRETLARYRSLADDPSLEPLPPVGATVRPGEPYAGAYALYRWLVAFGDLSADVSAPAALSAYDGTLVEGVKHFQIRHGLHADGVLGPATQAALHVPLAWRIRQIELALERLRWLPDLSANRYVMVNIPMFRLHGWEQTTSRPAVGMGAIVGRARRTQTPVFAADMRYVIFRPYWDVPASIVRHEMLRALERDPLYFERQDLEIVSGPGDDARPVAVSDESLEGLRAGSLRLRQRPGPNNSLGLVKFVFPNANNIYLHGTPAMRLFSQPRRDFSHGCVRVEDPVALAEWALKDQPEWTRDRILAAMNGDQPRRVTLTRPIRVILFYTTAAVDPDDHLIHFAEDIYGHDATLDRALASGPIIE